MTLNSKLLTAFGALTSALMIIAVIAVYGLSAVSNQFTAFINNDSARLKALHNVVKGVEARAVAARNLVLVKTPEDIATEKAEVEASHASVRTSLNELKDLLAKGVAPQSKEHELYREIDRIESLYSVVALDIVGLALDGRYPEAIAKMNNECRPLLKQLTLASIEYSKYLESVYQNSVSDVVDSVSRDRMVLWVISALSVGLSIALAFLVSRGILRSLGAEPAALGRAAMRISSGDLGTVEGVEKADKHSVLASLGEMQKSLSNLVGQVRIASESISMGAAQIASGSSDLSQRTESQASSLQETAAAMEQMSSAVRSSSESAKQAVEISKSATVSAEEGNEIVMDVVSTMDIIKSSSGEIAEIIGVIDSIAFQTNILALNAAVEAARAGEQGRGFSVVASEVRSLATRSTSAAREIKALIESSLRNVESGSKRVADAGESMVSIVSQVRNVTKLIGDISLSASEQTTGLDEVNVAVTDLDQVTQRNAALVEETAAASEQLRHEASRLDEMVRKFKLEGMASLAA